MMIEVPLIYGNAIVMDYVDDNPGSWVLPEVFTKAIHPSSSWEFLVSWEVLDFVSSFRIAFP